MFLVALATLMYEILLTRIFSVTMWYHFAFMAISVAMFGMTVGALLVYLFPQYFEPRKANYHLGLSSLLLAITIVFSFLTHLCIPTFANSLIFTFVGLFSLALTYTVISVPFVFSGIAVCLALTKFPRQVSRLYAVDLAGAALGCLLLTYVLKITDGPTTVFVVALFAALGALCFLAGAEHRRLRRWTLGLSLILGFISVANTALVYQQVRILRLLWVKGETEGSPLWEKWNSFSRVRIWGSPGEYQDPFGWGFSETYKPKNRVKQLHLNIDANAYTVLTDYGRKLENLDYLRYDITNFAHYLRPNANVYVIGVGGGRDVLSALVFNQKSVTGVEINDDIIGALTDDFSDYTGHLERNPKVRFVNDEARSYIARSKEEYDIIQSSLIDTWAATASGAFVFTESSLYTIEAWKIFLEHLSPDGVLTFSRWLSGNHNANYRLVAMANAALTQIGVKNPRDHIIIVAQRSQERAGESGIGSIMVSRSPFTSAHLDTVEAVAARLKYQIQISPREALDPTFAAIAEGRNLEKIFDEFPDNIFPPTDNIPFFFFFFKVRHLFEAEFWKGGPFRTTIALPIVILIALMVIVLSLTCLCIIGPLLLTNKKVPMKGSLPLFLFFGSIGFGFMMIEISQMQRLIMFLGHPTYGLSVVLFALLLSSGLGSYTTERINLAGSMRSVVIRLGCLLGLLVLFGLLTPPIVTAFRESTTLMRIIVAVAILFPLGMFMGMAFPLGMRIANLKSATLSPWLWGINGATSVCASVLAMTIALIAGISTTFWVGFLFYVLAFTTLTLAGRRVVQNLAQSKAA
ncbi:MAG: hypothetical protein C4524_01030 [Candidatus Zixiibacteriota bacterium]|nr:MAG: hypothetical protein C4524_01030 [candidate division Zixibacteria bacterium]